MMPHKPAHVANSILYKGRLDGVEIRPLKMQKLMYFLHGWGLATSGEPVVGEQFEAWPYGPVLSSVYQEFKGYGSDPITEYACEFDPESGEEKRLMVSPNNAAFQSLLDSVWNKYKIFSGPQLSAMTHAEGTPWKEVRDAGMTYIPNEKINEYFTKLARLSS
jgi:uncharacterized phage-associated protein